MAKFRSQSRAMTVSRPVVVQVPAPRRAARRVARGARRVGALARRGGIAVAKKAFEEKLTVGAVVGSGVIGYLDGSGNLPGFIPEVMGTKIPAIAAGFYFGGAALKSKNLRYAGIGLACVAAFEIGQAQGVKRK